MAKPNELAEPSEPRYDTVTIFGEFDDSERRSLVQSMMHRYPSLHQISRNMFFILWFSDIDKLRWFASKESDENVMEALTERFEQDSPVTDVPGMCKDTKDPWTTSTTVTDHSTLNRGGQKTTKGRETREGAK